jgi:hypothetical protein
MKIILPGCDGVPTIHLPVTIAPDLVECGGELLPGYQVHGTEALARSFDRYQVDFILEAIQMAMNEGSEFEGSLFEDGEGPVVTWKADDDLVRFVAEHAEEALPIGRFHCRSGVMAISDPCYQVSSPGPVFVDAEPGEWLVEVRMAAGDVVSASLFRPDCRFLDAERQVLMASVDAGMLGAYDRESLTHGKRNDRLIRYDHGERFRLLPWGLTLNAGADGGYPVTVFMRGGRAARIEIPIRSGMEAALKTALRTLK